MQAAKWLDPVSDRSTASGMVDEEGSIAKIKAVKLFDEQEQVVFMVAQLGLPCQLQSAKFVPSQFHAFEFEGFAGAYDHGPY